MPSHTAPRSCPPAPLIAVLVLIAHLSTAPVSQAADISWIGPDGGLWSVPANWTPTGKPQDGQIVLVGQSGDSPITVRYRHGNGFVPTFDTVLVDASGSAPITLEMTGPRTNELALFSLDEVVGAEGRGIFVQSGGINILNGGQGFRDGVGNLVMGQMPGSEGTYRLSGTRAWLAFAGPEPLHFMIVGDEGSGRFEQTGGLALITEIAVGRSAGSHGYVELDNSTGNPLLDDHVPTFAEVSGDAILALAPEDPLPYTGVIAVGHVDLGIAGTGEMRQRGGILLASGVLQIGGERRGVLTRPLEPPGEGQYVLEAGRVAAGQTVVGSLGVGTFEQMGGLHSTNTSLVVGDAVGSRGRYVLDGGELRVGGVTVVGRSGLGAFEQTGGLLSAPGSMVIARDVGATGSYRLSSGELRVGDLFDGDDGSATFEQTGGRLHADSGIYVGSTTTPAAFTLSGDAHLDAYGVFVGFAGTDAGSRARRSGNGTFVQRGGTVDIFELEVGHPGAARDGTPTYRMEGGRLDLHDVGYIGGVFNDDYGSPGVFEQLGGEVNADGFGHVAVTGRGSRYLLADGSLHAFGLGSFVGADIEVRGGSIDVQQLGALDGNLTVTGATASIHVSGVFLVGARPLDPPFASDGWMIQRAGSVIVDSAANGRNLLIEGAGHYLLEGGHLRVDGDETVGGFSNVFGASASFEQVGGTHDVLGTLRVVGLQRLLPSALPAPGSFHLGGGTLNAARIVNQGSMSITGGTLTAGDLDDVGVFAVTHSTVRLGNLVVHDGGAFRAGSDAVVELSGSLFEGNGDAHAWETDDAILRFVGNGPHQFALAGFDFGPSARGFADNFAWGAFELDADAVAELVDASVGDGAALYVRRLGLVGGLDALGRIHSDFDIYYDTRDAANLWLGGGRHALGGMGWLIGIDGVAQVDADAPTSGALVAVFATWVALWGGRRRRIAD